MTSNEITALITKTLQNNEIPIQLKNTKDEMMNIRGLEKAVQLVEGVLN